MSQTQRMKTNTEKIIEYEKLIIELKKQIDDDQQKISESCEGHLWVIDYVDYDRVYYKCSKNCGAWK
jgi:hypothetical protein